MAIIIYKFYLKNKELIQVVGGLEEFSTRDTGALFLYIFFSLSAAYTFFYFDFENNNKLLTLKNDSEHSSIYKAD